MTETTVVLHGATGTQGRAILRGLLTAGHHVRAVARNPVAHAAVQPFAADLLDVEALTAAYTGADAVVVQLPINFEDHAVRQTEAVLAALAKAGVRRAVFNTGGGLPPSSPIGVPFVDARVRLALELPNVVEHASVTGPAGPYLENLVAPWSVALIRDRGELRYPIPASAPVPWLAAADLGTVIADLTLAAAPAPACVVAGPVLLTGPELAAALSTAAGREVRWQTIDPAEYAGMLAPHLGEATAAGIASVYTSPAPAPDPATLTHGETTAAAWAAEQTF
ncbi:NmrA family NAD(P)-binding protein [Actinoplanes sichuanensis]|uniref:SDR family oxidoreductase n=1 Tax=Actinoplanes sichuanensis TaxID=512349 RepID=A0ABW4AFM2_9ACTN|nr:NAD(P)H-binding protein [Actinoplanes sichuanensis]BEL02624.1 NmrA family NAD(P)-binding protein [Actinoplanes sichuanensis]